MADTETNQQKIDRLLTKAVNAESADSAMKFTQAALNAANALHVIAITKNQQ